MDTRNTNSPDPGLTEEDRAWIAATTARRQAIAVNLSTHAAVTDDDLHTTLRTLRRLAEVEVDRAFPFRMDGSGNPVNLPNEEHTTWSDAADLQDRFHSIHAWVAHVWHVREAKQATSERGAASWDAVAVWTLITSVCAGFWALIAHGLLSSIGIDTWVKLLNVVEVVGLCAAAYAAMCLYEHATRPAPLDTIVRPRDERGAADGVGILIAGGLLLGVGLLSAYLTGRA